MNRKEASQINKMDVSLYILIIDDIWADKSIVCIVDLVIDYINNVCHLLFLTKIRNTH